MKINIRHIVLAFLLVTAVGAGIYFYRTPEPSVPAPSAPKPTKALKSQSSPPPAKAPSTDAMMRGLNPIMVLVEELPSAASSCGLNREAIRVAVELPLSQSGLQITKSPASSKGYLYIQVNVLLAQNICAANIYFSFRTPGVIEGNKQLTIASIWNENIIGAAWPNDAAREINSAVDKLTKKFVEEWTRDNPEP
jgi:hypothetical protein